MTKAASITTKRSGTKTFTEPLFVLISPESGSQSKKAVCVSPSVQGSLVVSVNNDVVNGICCSLSHK